MKKISIISLVFITMLFLVSFAALAQNEGELLQSALSSYQAGDLNASQEALEKARLLLWNKAPMKMVNPVFTEGEAQSYGYYTKRLSNFFAADEKLFVYVEPKNYTIREESGAFHIYFTVDFNVYDTEGNFIGGQESFSDFRYVTASPVFEVFLVTTLNFDLEPGDYIVEIICRDKFSDKKASFNLPFKK